MNKKQIFLWILCATFLIYGLFDYIDYQKRNLDVTGFTFVCNQRVCEIRHRVANKGVKYTDKIDISKIEKFSTKLEKVPRTNKKGLVIYAECKDGTRFRFSPLYITPSKWVQIELIDKLNAEIKRRPVDIIIIFPNSYW